MRITPKITIAALAAVVLLGACSEPASEAPRREVNSEKYARDRAECRAQVDEYMKTRRVVDDSRREVFSGQQERYGNNALPDQMDAYGDSRRANRFVDSCMENRGWPQQKSWWQRIGS